MGWSTRGIVDAQQSFATRQRMIDPTGAAFDVIDRWIANVRGRPRANVAANRPHDAEDACFAGDGTLLYRGRPAWAGVLDRRPPGPCTARFPLHTTSRVEAGGGNAGDMFKCALTSVDAAVADGTYGGVALTADERARLKEIFPDGVCDYSKPDVGRPAGP